MYIYIKMYACDSVCVCTQLSLIEYDSQLIANSH